MPRSQMAFEDADIEETPPSIGILLPHITPILRLQRVLIVDAYIAIEEGDIDRVLMDLRAISGIHRQSCVLGTMIERMVQFRIGSSALILVRSERMDLEVWSDDQLDELSEVLTDLVIGDTVKGAIDFEYWSMRSIMDWVFIDSDDGRLSARGAKRFINMAAMMTTLSGDQFFDDQVEGLAAISRAMKLRRTVKPKEEQLDLLDELYLEMHDEFSDPPHKLGSFEASARIERLASDPQNRMAYAPVLVVVSDYSRFFERLLYNQGEAHAARLRVKLAQHRNTNSKYPSSITSLGEFIDPYSGDSLKYKLIDGQPLIYSVGPDRDDDGGTRIRDAWGDPVTRPEFIPLDDLEAISEQEREEIDGDWVLYPHID